MELNAPPILRNTGVQHNIKTLEGESHVIRQDFRFPLFSSDLGIQFQEVEEETRPKNNLSSRLYFAIGGNTLRLEIKNASLSDNGSYEVNISNQYGHVIVPFTLAVTATVKTNVDITLMDISCSSVHVSSCVAIG